MFDIDGRPPILKCLPLSMQHILAMIVGTVTVPIVVGGAVGVSPTQITLLVQYALIIAGISTLIQLYPIGNIGSRLPIIFGVGFTYVPTLVAVGGNYGLASILGAQLIGGVATVLIGIFIKKIRKFFPNIVAGTVVFTIGLSLYPIAINYMAGGVNSPTYASMQNWA
ncbi:TPA: purine permease, partial [Clostridioides difficile]|nr:purine permease [Clostridioides difficile]HBF3674850.1 purine permease [Clostridioides difficile]HBF5169989.1 purine permease [Clostridioides difficile]